ncbi:hypothetical protein O9G_006354 [Rozella allomycis CSF55]|uniref:Uncharacterized protein n=1 Tax=Rozella allomycis (strain CSF55) TaxID=988480 RepID=A0A075AME4_ROZAC|nr:hypothetical protein O9G_006354 [Rozella allomycis CSF55]|eukprot:EPZ30761.1 hypothetical protein O9G_006354 [Rozella allomycis CSF55]
MKLTYATRELTNFPLSNCEGQFRAFFRCSALIPLEPGEVPLGKELTILITISCCTEMLEDGSDVATPLDIKALEARE